MGNILRAEVFTHSQRKQFSYSAHPRKMFFPPKWNTSAFLLYGTGARLPVHHAWHQVGVHQQHDSIESYSVLISYSIRRLRWNVQLEINVCSEPHMLLLFEGRIQIHETINCNSKNVYCMFSVNCNGYMVITAKFQNCF